MSVVDWPAACAHVVRSRCGAAAGPIAAMFAVDFDGINDGTR